MFEKKTISGLSMLNILKDCQKEERRKSLIITIGVLFICILKHYSEYLLFKFFQIAFSWPIN